MITTYTLEKRLQHVEACIEEVDYANYLLQRAKTITEQGDAANKLANAVHDLKTWHRQYDENRQMLPWEMEDEDL